MTPISCPQCGGLSAYRIRPDGLFGCPECGDLLDRRDIDLDGSDVWGVDDDGTLCIVTDPGHSLECLMQAVEEYLTADECPNAEYARRSAIRSIREFLGDYAEARRIGIQKPEIGYTREKVSVAMNEGADMILGEISLGEPEEDAINLVVNAAMTRLENPCATFEEMAAEQYSESADEIRSWWGWS
ncbi:transposase [Streptomyces marianii]|uniref:Transposase n=1 Tax=Streptomyces marianii TaxID=1817406 RepID=A0A5R9DT95_9ACTN|nr:transposase [Streptomyces marianii]TLQ38875.1 transposase [Streptomyces marianii]